VSSPSTTPRGPLDTLAAEIHDHGREQGFWDRAQIKLADDPSEPRFAPPRHVSNPSIVPEKLALAHSEISEALDALRDDDLDHFEEELADVVIRILDVAEFKGLSMDRAVAAKMAKNRERPRLNGRSF
jgi:MazG-like nucleotide pyrophosphohydrolase family protein